MSPLGQDIAAIINSTENRIAQLRELEGLREQVRKACAVGQESATSERRGSAGRILVRLGCKGWMVYDRTDAAVNLTKEQNGSTECGVSVRGQ